VDAPATPLDDLLRASPDAVQCFVQRVLAPVLRLPERERQDLLLTAAVWFASGRSLCRAAEQLYCHRNTVRLRLRRLSIVLGRELSPAAPLLDLELALRGLPCGPQLHGRLAARDDAPRH
jgi:DNA-binding PucR family transcriptional regulator